MPRVTLAKLLGSGAVALLLLLTIPAHAKPDSFVQSIGDRAFESLGKDGLSDSDRQARFSELLKEAFDLPRIGRFVLGVHWRRASDSEKEEFLALFEKFLTQAYANRFRDLSGKKFVVTQAKELTDKETLVLSRVEITGEPPIDVTWKVRNSDGAFKIVDVAVEGISMSVTQRDEFASVIRQTGGKVSGLIKALRRKTGN